MSQPSPNLQPTPRSRPLIVLVGMMGSGKTTVGRLLAGQLDIPFIDNDAALRRRTGAGPGEVKAEVGADELHAMEAGLLRDRLLDPPREGAVISAAASVVLEQQTRELLRRTGNVAWLKASAATLAARVHTALDGRPSFESDMVGWLTDATAARASLYADVANVTVDVDELPPWRITQRVLDALGLGVFGWLPGSFEGVVLDLDGLLVDTEVIWAESKRRLYAARGIPYSIEDHRAVLGTSEDYTVKVFAQRFGVGEDEHEHIRDDYLGHTTKLFREGVPIRPGARELIASLHGRVPLGLASNTRRELVEMVLEGADLGTFDAIVTGDEATPKPDAGLYLEACRRLGVTPGRSCAVEDSPTGVRGAKAAGLACIGVPSDPDNVPDGADRIVDSLLELIEPAAAT